MGAAPRGLGRVFDLSADPSAMRRDDSRDAAVRQLDAKIGDGAQARRIGSVSVSATAVDVPHKLGRKLVGWRIADIDTVGVTVARSPSSDDTKWLALTASGPAIIAVEVW